jgi:hypothetical protein
VARRKGEFEWAAIRLRASLAIFIGYGSAPDEEAALAGAIVRFKISPGDKKRQIVRGK